MTDRDRAELQVAAVIRAVLGDLLATLLPTRLAPADGRGQVAGFCESGWQAGDATLFDHFR